MIKRISGFSALVAITAAALLALRIAVMLSTPVFEPSEARYAAISANMARTGDFLVPRFTYKGVYRSFDGKPPLVFQAGGAACRAFGVSEFAVRLFPFLCALLTLAILFLAVRRLKNAAAAWKAVCICLTSTAFFAAMGFCMTDIPLTCCVAGSLLLYACCAGSGRVGWPDTLGISALLGAGMLVKGPVALALFGLPVLADCALNRRWRLLASPKWLAGAALAAAVAAPWFVMMESRNPGFLKYFFINENIMRFLVHDYGDRYGAGRETFRGMAAVYAVVVTLPWSVMPIWSAVARRQRRGARASLRRGFAESVRSSFCLLAVVVIALFWSLTSRVPVAYLFPVVPLFAAWHAARPGRVRFRRMLPLAAACSAAVLLGTVLCTRCFTNKMPGESAPRRTGNRYSHEFYHGPWGRPETEEDRR